LTSDIIIVLLRCCKLQFVLLDQFGVLHDGQQPYPQAIAAVKQLHAAGKQVLVLSNSSRRSGGTIGKLAKMGFKEEWFAGEYMERRHCPHLWHILSSVIAPGAVSLASASSCVASSS
jgi:hypothetical protein